MLDLLSILVICAEGEHQERIVGAIQKRGLRPTCCCSFREALRLLTRQTFGLVFCEDTLPDGEFRTALREIRKSAANVPVIVLSRLAEWNAYLSAIDAGAFDYVAYPPDSTGTEGILRVALRESSRFHRSAHAAA